MVKGYENRPDVQDPNLTINESGVKPNDIPIAPVQSPRPSSMAAVGSQSRELAGLLSKGSSLMEDYFNKQKDKWRLEGQMMYAQGKTAEELSKAGYNQYTTEGYQSLQVSTMLENWKQSKLLALAEGDEQKLPSQYSQELQSGFGDLVSGIDSPYVKSIIVSHAERDLPHLLSQQMVQHAQFVKTKTIESNTNALIAAANSTALDKNLQPIKDQLKVIDALPEDARRKVLRDAVEATMRSKNNSLKDYIVGSKSVETERVVYKNNNPGNIRGNDGKFIKYASPEEGYQAMEHDLMVKISGKSDAMKAKFGENYAPTIKNIISVYAPSSDKNNPEKYADFVAKKTGLLKDQILSEANVKAVQEAMITFEGSASKEKVTKQNDIVESLTQQGWDVKDATVIKDLSDSLARERNNVYIKERFSKEEEVLARAAAQGDLGKALDEIQALHEQDPDTYTVQWANSVSGQIPGKIAEYQKVQETNLMIDGAIATNSVSLLSGKERDMAWKRLAAQDQQEISKALENGSYAIEAHKTGKTENQIATEKFLEKQIRHSVDNRVVHPGLANQMNLAMKSASLLTDPKSWRTQDGSLTPQAARLVDSVGAYYQLMTTPGSDTVFADQHLDDQSKKLVNEVLALDKDGMDLPHAVQQAVANLDRANRGIKIPDVPDTVIKQSVKEVADDMFNPGFWSTVLGVNGIADANFWNVTDGQLERFGKDPELMASIEKSARLMVRSDPSMSPKAAAIAATKKTIQNGTMIMGNWVQDYSGVNNPKAAMGLQFITDPLAPHMAMTDMLNSMGTDLWPGLWASNNLLSQVTGRPLNEAGQALFGSQPVKILYDSKNQEFIVDLYLDKEQNILAGRPKTFSAKRVGDWWLNQNKDLFSQSTATKKLREVLQPFAAKSMGLAQSAAEYLTK